MQTGHNDAVESHGEPLLARGGNFARFAEKARTLRDNTEPGTGKVNICRGHAVDRSDAVAIETIGEDRFDNRPLRQPVGFAGGVIIKRPVRAPLCRAYAVAGAGAAVSAVSGVAEAAAAGGGVAVWSVLRDYPPESGLFLPDDVIRKQRLPFLRPLFRFDLRFLVICGLPAGAVRSVCVPPAPGRPAAGRAGRHIRVRIGSGLLLQLTEPGGILSGFTEQFRLLLRQRGFRLADFCGGRILLLLRRWRWRFSVPAPQPGSQ